MRPRDEKVLKKVIENLIDRAFVKHGADPLVTRNVVQRTS